MLPVSWSRGVLGRAFSLRRRSYAPLRVPGRRGLRSARRRSRAINTVEALEDRTLLSVDLLASAVDPVHFATAQQSMWGPDGPPVIDTGLLFAGTSWDLAAHPTISINSNNFVTLDAATSGSVGIDFRAILDPGSVDATYASQATLDVFAGADNTFTIVSQVPEDATGSLSTRSPNIDVESNFTFEFAASLGIRGEIGTPDVTLTVPHVVFEPRTVNLGIFGTHTIHVPVVRTVQVTVPGIEFAFNQQLLDFNFSDTLQLLKVTNREISILEQTLAAAEPGENLSFTFDLGFNPVTFTPEVDLVDEGSSPRERKPHDVDARDETLEAGVSFSMGDITVEVPTLNLEQNQFSTENGQTGLRTSGATDLARLDIDADFLASVLFGLPPLGASGEISANVPVIGSVTLVGFSYDLLDVDIGPQFSIGQDFEFVPELWVDLTFSEPVMIGGQQVSQHSMRVGSSLDVVFDGAAAGESLDVQTRYTLRNQFRNTTELLVAPQVDVLALAASFETFLGPLFDETLFDPDPIRGPAETLATLFDDTYTLGGFNTPAGQPLHLDFNKPPVINPEDLTLSAPTVDEGSPVGLSGSFADPNAGQTHTVSIDWGDGSEPTVLELPADVFSFGPADHVYADGAASHDISVTVTDDKNESDEAQTSIDVLNVAPTLALAGSSLNLDDNGQPIPFSGVRGQQLDVSGLLSDPGFDNPALGTVETFTYIIDFGDGTSIGPLAVTDVTPGAAGVPSTGSFAAGHVYTEDGSYTLTLTVADDDGDSTVVTQIVTIAASSLQAGGDLAIGGTTGDDGLHLGPQSLADGTSGIEVSASGSAEWFPGVHRILVFLQDGDDNLQVAGSLSTPVWAFGGSGNDRIKGGAGHDLLDGGTGHDLLIGGGGRDLLIGGEGADRLVGNADDDILIAGWLNFADPLAAIERIMAEWTSDHDLLARLANLGGVNDGSCEAGLNDGYFLKSGETVESSDGDRDFLTGASGDDWFFFDPDEDKATDLKDEVFANDLEFILGA